MVEKGCDDAAGVVTAATPIPHVVLSHCAHLICFPGFMDRVHEPATESLCR